jgi:3-hydroxyisobutyrate dehydrogenase-like beta-hydroxyacid dehydrogenase
MNKDFRLILHLAGEVHVPMPATSASFQANSEALTVHGDQYFSVVIKFVQELSAAKLAGPSMAG